MFPPIGLRGQLAISSPIWCPQTGTILSDRSPPSPPRRCRCPPSLPCRRCRSPPPPIWCPRTGTIVLDRWRENLRDSMHIGENLGTENNA